MKLTSHYKKLLHISRIPKINTHGISMKATISSTLFLPNKECGDVCYSTARITVTVSYTHLIYNLKSTGIYSSEFFLSDFFYILQNNVINRKK